MCPAFCLACSVGSREMPPSHPSASWDLSPLLAHLAGVRVLGLGEPTHGTAQAFRWKGEVIRTLAEAGRLRVLAWECGYATGRLLDAALRFGRRDMESALRAQRFWAWETLEILETLVWLRDWNLARPAPGRVRFVGVDVQELYEGVCELIAAGHPHPALARLTRKGEVETGGEEARELLAVLGEVEAAEADPARRALARNARRFVDAYLLEENHARLGLRDRFMAETLLEEGLTETGLTVFWAHNEHVAVNPDFAGDPATGWVLRGRLGSDYLAVGVLMGKGTFRARNLDAPERPLPLAVLPIGLPAPHHSDALFLGLGDRLHETRDHPHPGPRRFLGGQYGPQRMRADPHLFEMARPLSDFDLLMFLERTTAARGLA